MSSRAAGVPRSLILVVMLATAVVGCDRVTNTLPSTQPAAEPSTPAAVGSATGDAVAPVPSGTSADPFVAWPAFAACLRAHGLDVADPELDAVGEPHWGDDLKRSLTPPVRAACAPIIAVVDEGGTLRGHGLPSFSFDSLVAHATCVRAHGLDDWPDPDGNATNWAWPERFGRTDPAVLAALDACEGVLVPAAPSPSSGS